MSSASLPVGWASVDFCDLLLKLANGTTAEQHKDPPGIPVSRIETISEAKINFGKVRYVRDVSPELRERFLLHPGDILFSHINSDSHLGKCALYRGGTELLHGMNLLVLRVSPAAQPEFIEQYLTYLRARGYFIQIAQHAVNQSSLNQKKINQITLPLPPLPEQKRIVAKIEELFSELEAGEESLRVARRQLGVYRQSLLKQAFEGKLTAQWRAQNPDKLESPSSLLARIQSTRQARAGTKKTTPLVPFPATELVGDFTLPPGWLVLSYGDLCSVVRNGISQKPSGETGQKIARISAVRPMAFDYEDYRFIDCDAHTATDYTLVHGDLIFTRYNGARRFVGVCAQFRGQEPRLYPDKLIRTRPDLPMLDPRYLEIALNCGLSRAWLETKIRTTAGQSGVSGGDIKAMPVPLCSLPEQQEIVRLLDEQFEVIERNEREIDAALKRSEALRQAILHRAFTGRLVPQDPADPPATALLARLRAERAAAPAARRSRASS